MRESFVEALKCKYEAEIAAGKATASQREGFSREGGPGGDFSDFKQGGLAKQMKRSGLASKK